MGGRGIGLQGTSTGSEVLRESVTIAFSWEGHFVRVSAGLEEWNWMDDGEYLERENTTCHP